MEITSEIVIQSVRVILTAATLCIFSLQPSLAFEQQSGVARLVRDFPLGVGEAIFCYDQNPKFIFVGTDKFNQTHDLIEVGMSGNTSKLTSIDGDPIDGTLSCSVDGRIIALVAKKNNFYYLTILHDRQLSRYQFLQWPIDFPIQGKNSLMDEYGTAIAVPADYKLVAGADFLSTLEKFYYPKVKSSKNNEDFLDGKIFFQDGYLFYEHEKKLDVYFSWNKDWTLIKANLDLNGAFSEAIEMCSDKLIDEIGIDESNEPLKLVEIKNGILSKKSIDLGQLKDFDASIVAIGASLDKCAFVASAWKQDHFKIINFAKIQSDRAIKYKIAIEKTSNSDTDLANFKIDLSKDGMLLLVALEQVNIGDDKNGIKLREKQRISVFYLSK